MSNDTYQKLNLILHAQVPICDKLAKMKMRNVVNSEVEIFKHG